MAKYNVWRVKCFMVRVTVTYKYYKEVMHTHTYDMLRKELMLQIKTFMFTYNPRYAYLGSLYTSDLNATGIPSL